MEPQFFEKSDPNSGPFDCTVDLQIAQRCLVEEMLDAVLKGDLESLKKAGQMKKEPPKRKSRKLIEVLGGAGGFPLLPAATRQRGGGELLLKWHPTPAFTLNPQVGP